ncbi:glycosyltransferase family 4 protein [bacterium]|nr:glycosyltransferase family 4 protein [bacterium]
MIKVAIIEPVGSHGGMNYYNLAQARSLASNECDVFLYTCRGPRVTSSPSMHVIESFRGIWGNLPRAMRGVNFIISLLYSILHAKIHGIKIAHFHLFHFSALELLCVKATKLFNMKVVITVHDVKSFDKARNDKYSKSILSRADRLIVHNKISATELRKIQKDENSKIEIIKHGNYFDSIEKSPRADDAKIKLGLKPTSPVVLFFGQIKEVKGLDLLIEAMKQAIEVHPDLHLLIAGKPWRQSFQPYLSLIESKGLSNNVTCHIHYIPDSDVNFYYGSADLVVLPYREIYQSGVLLMAMSYSKAVLVSDIPGMSEIVAHAKNGYTFANGDSHHLAVRLIEIFNKKAELSDIGNAARDLMAAEYSWTEIGLKTKSLYMEVLREG